MQLVFKPALSVSEFLYDVRMPQAVVQFRADSPFKRVRRKSCRPVLLISTECTFSQRLPFFSLYAYTLDKVPYNNGSRSRFWSVTVERDLKVVRQGQQFS